MRRNMGCTLVRSMGPPRASAENGYLNKHSLRQYLFIDTLGALAGSVCWATLNPTGMNILTMAGM